MNAQGIASKYTWRTISRRIGKIERIYDQAKKNLQFQDEATIVRLIYVTKLSHEMRDDFSLSKRKENRNESKEKLV